jgi:hypothetical protein
MILMPAMRHVALFLCCALFGMAHAQSAAPLTVPLQETQLVAAGTAAAPIQQTFTISTSEDLVVTLTDLEIPAELVSAGVVVTQDGAIAGSGQLAAPATNASVSLPAASGVYTLYVFGVPNANYSVGSYSVCVAPKAAPANCIQSASLSGLLTAPDSTKDPTVSTLSTTLSVTTAGSYTFNFSDLTFPVALNTAPSLALFQGATPIIPPGQTSPGITSGTALTLSPGTYTLLSIAQADQTVMQGLYNIVIAGAAGSAPLFSAAIPVGSLAAATSVTNPSAQTVTLTVADYGFPGPLASASAVLTSDGTLLGSASAAGGAQSFSAPAGNLSLWTYGSMGSTAGTFSADVSAGSTDLGTSAQGVSPSGTTYTYAYVEGVATAGAFEATATDLQFPSQLAGLAFAVAQNGLILQQSTTATTLDFNAAVGNVVLLVSAQAPTSTTAPNGLFDVNVQSPSGAKSLVCTQAASAASSSTSTSTSTSTATAASTTPAATALCDQTQSVSSTPALFNVQALTVADDGSYDVTLSDLKFPTAFDSLALVVSRGSQVLGKVFGAGKFSFTGTPGTYQLTFVASPSSDQLFGLYGVSVANSPPTVTLTSSAASVTSGSSVTLSFSSTNATSCTASGGWTGTEPTSASTATETVSATTTYTLTCTGAGGTATQSVTVTATAAPSSSHGGGGSLDASVLAALSALVLAQAWRRRPAAAARG